ncbi:MAG: peroxiredoxin-like family protein [Melioribacteraceae bacterium]|nr:peroxiredoxin-like family protein [Melioribacteraceae bacterium]
MKKVLEFSLIILFVITIQAAGSQLKNKMVAENANEICPVLTGQQIPDVLVTNLDDTDKNLRELVSAKPTVLIFYRGGWCPYCNSHLSELIDVEDDLTKLGYQILAVSMDKPSKLKETLDKTEINYTLLSDADAEAVKAFGLAFRVEDELNEKYLKMGIDLEASSGESHQILPVPAAFILDTDGKIHYSYVNPDYKTRINAEVLLKAAETAIR